MKLKLLIINFLTLIRIIGVILIIPIYHRFGGYYVGILTFICYLTDSLDGILARKWHASTFFGALFDGTADKLFTIMNFVVLYLITPYALISIILELLIILTQFIKFKKKLNLKSNIIGKCKVWFLAICVVLTFFLSDISHMPLLSVEIKNNLMSFNPSILYLILLSPAIIMEIFTLISYILEIIAPKKIKRLNVKHNEMIVPELKNKTKWERFKYIWLNPEFYDKHKNDSNLRKITKLNS